MIQKVIKIGSSAGVTIPRKQLKELGLSIGDEVKINLESTSPRPSAHDVEVYKLTQKLINRHKKALKNLADR